MEALSRYKVSVHPDAMQLTTRNILKVGSGPGSVWRGHFLKFFSAGCENAKKLIEFYSQIKELKE